MPIGRRSRLPFWLPAADKMAFFALASVAEEEKPRLNYGKTDAAFWHTRCFKS